MATRDIPAAVYQGIVAIPAAVSVVIPVTAAPDLQDIQAIAAFQVIQAQAHPVIPATVGPVFQVTQATAGSASRAIVGIPELEHPGTLDTAASQDIVVIPAAVSAAIPATVQ